MCELNSKFGDLNSKLGELNSKLGESNSKLGELKGLINKLVNTCNKFHEQIVQEDFKRVNHVQEDFKRLYEHIHLAIVDMKKFDSENNGKTLCDDERRLYESMTSCNNQFYTFIKELYQQLGEFKKIVPSIEEIDQNKSDRKLLTFEKIDENKLISTRILNTLINKNNELESMRLANIQLERFKVDQMCKLENVSKSLQESQKKALAFQKKYLVACEIIKNQSKILSSNYNNLSSNFSKIYE